MKTWLTMKTWLKELDLLLGRMGTVTLLTQTLVVNFLLLVPTVYMLQVYDRILISRNELSLLFVSGLCLYLFGVLFVTELTRANVLAKLADRLQVRLSAVAVTQELATDRTKNSASEMKWLNFIKEIKAFFNGPTVVSILDLPFSPIYLGVLYMLHPVLLVLSVVLIAVQVAFAVVSYVFTTVSFEASKAASQQEAYALRTYMRNFDAMIAMGMMGWLERTWNRFLVRANVSATTSQSAAHAFASASKGLRYVQQALSLSVGAYLVMQDELSAGGMIAANVLVSRALLPIDSVVTHWRTVRSAHAAWRALIELVNQTVALPARGLSVGVPSRIEPVIELDGRTLRLKSGQVSLLVGEPGSGKSTALESLVGLKGKFYDAFAWRFALDDGAAEWTYADLPGASVGFAGQRIELFNESIAINICRLQALDSAQVVAAARLLGLHEVILSLPEGYQTRVTTALPVGLRQRIALARAFYGSPQLLVLDEPHAALDAEGERSLMNALTSAKARGTTVVIAGHGSGLMSVADQLVVMRGHDIVACGPKEAILNELARGRTS